MYRSRGHYDGYGNFLLTVLTGGSRYARRDCHPRAVVVTSPQQVVYTTTAPAATVYQPYPSNMTAQPAPAQYGYPPGPSAYQPQPGYAYQPPQNPNAPPNPSVVLPPPEYKE
ncbi:unnamed protein product [Nippostrongylus brasiliensis]|uniref:Protein shisa-5 n=1 Tax=Nippostrongylus brasiliensis TaxID=27835 RepID=A0A158QYW6_NIPBR|nr:unnamed protein product [Nippostrongylus brasiliensis]